MGSVLEFTSVSDANSQRRLFRFGMFELDIVTGELRKDGRSRPRIRDQALQILTMLLEKSDDLVTREELRERLWPGDTFVDFDHGLNTAINQVRSALGDSASNPKFIQTLPRRGYRFIAPVQTVSHEIPVDTGANQTNFATKGEQSQKGESPPSKTRLSILSDDEDLPVIRNEIVRILFSLIQLMYVIFYIVSLARLSKVETILNASGKHSVPLFVILIVTAAIGIPIRFYLLTAVAFNYLGLNTKFRTLFPFVLVLDEAWAFTPFLLVQQIGVGLAIACTAALLYLPFSQRSLLLMGSAKKAGA
jgi:cholera toxin transcriptional activator